MASVVENALRILETTQAKIMVLSTEVAALSTEVAEQVAALKEMLGNERHPRRRVDESALEKADIVGRITCYLPLRAQGDLARVSRVWTGAVPTGMETLLQALGWTRHDGGIVWNPSTPLRVHCATVANLGRVSGDPPSVCEFMPGHNPAGARFVHRTDWDTGLRSENGCLFDMRMKKLIIGSVEAAGVKTVAIVKFATGGGFFLEPALDNQLWDFETAERLHIFDRSADQSTGETTPTYWYTVASRGRRFVVIAGPHYNTHRYDETVMRRFLVYDVDQGGNVTLTTQRDVRGPSAAYLCLSPCGNALAFKHRGCLYVWRDLVDNSQPFIHLQWDGDMTYSPNIWAIAWSQADDDDDDDVRTLYMAVRNETTMKETSVMMVTLKASRLDIAASAAPIVHTSDVFGIRQLVANSKFVCTWTEHRPPESDDRSTIVYIHCARTLDLVATFDDLNPRLDDCDTLMRYGVVGFQLFGPRLVMTFELGDVVVFDLVEKTILKTIPTLQGAEKHQGLRCNGAMLLPNGFTQVIGYINRGYDSTERDSDRLPTSGQNWLKVWYWS